MAIYDSIVILHSTIDYGKVIQINHSTISRINTTIIFSSFENNFISIHELFLHT